MAIMRSLKQGLWRRAAGAALAAISLAPASARALPINRTFGNIPGSNSFVYEDSENRARAPLIRLYYIPTRSRVEEFSFNVLGDDAVVASFSLSLQMSKALEGNTALLKQQAAAVYNVSPDRVQVLPLPLFESETILRTNPSLIRDAIIPEPDTPIDGQLHFEVEFTMQGWEQFKARVVRGQGLFATYRGKAHLIDTATETPWDVSVSVPLKLENLPLCRVVVEGC